MGGWTPDPISMRTQNKRRVGSKENAVCQIRILTMGNKIMRGRCVNKAFKKGDIRRTWFAGMQDGESTNAGK